MHCPVLSQDDGHHVGGSDDDVGAPQDHNHLSGPFDFRYHVCKFLDYLDMFLVSSLILGFE